MLLQNENGKRNTNLHKDCGEPQIKIHIGHLQIGLTTESIKYFSCTVLEPHYGLESP